MSGELIGFLVLLAVLAVAGACLWLWRRRTLREHREAMRRLPPRRR